MIGIYRYIYGFQSLKCFLKLLFNFPVSSFDSLCVRARVRAPVRPSIQEISTQNWMVNAVAQTNKLEPVEGVLATLGLELWLWK
jgi:hypothetical protein